MVSLYSSPVFGYHGHLIYADIPTLLQYMLLDAAVLAPTFDCHAQVHASLVRWLAGKNQKPNISWQTLGNFSWGSLHLSCFL